MTQHVYDNAKTLLRIDNTLNNLATDVVYIGSLHDLSLEAYDYTLATLYNHMHNNKDCTQDMEQLYDQVYCKVHQGLESMIQYYSLKTK